MPRKNGPRNPHGYLNVDKMRQELGLTPDCPEAGKRRTRRGRRRPQVIKMTRHVISSPRRQEAPDSLSGAPGQPPLKAARHDRRSSVTTRYRPRTAAAPCRVGVPPRR
jgi:hypothetical protein